MSHNRLFTLFTGLLTILLLTGCPTTKQCEIPPLPEPATTTGLAGAEAELDKATAERLSKAAASVGASYLLAKNNPESHNNSVLLSELKLTKTLLGKAEEKDWVTVKTRVESALKPDADLLKLYEKEVASATALRVRLKEVDAKYEAEKAKKQAEFDAKLLEREQALKQEKELRRIEADEARRDKFVYAGGLLMAISVIWFIFGNKVQGLQGIAAGFVIASVGYIWDSPYFKYAVGVLLGIGLIKLVMVVFAKKPAPAPLESPAEDTPTKPSGDTDSK